jgi:hypothetical protein
MDVYNLHPIGRSPLERSTNEDHHSSAMPDSVGRIDPTPITLTCTDEIKSLPIHDPSYDWFIKFSDLKVLRDKLADVLDEAGRLKEANSVRYCGEDFVVYEASCCGDTIAHPMSCGHRLCPVCMIRRSTKLSSRVNKFIVKMKKPKHIVLTVENVSNIDKAYFSWLRHCFVKLRHRRIFDKCIGGFYSIETTYNSEKKNWHVHIHVVADVHIHVVADIPYIPKQELVDEWNDITESSFIVDIKEISGKGQSPLEAAREVAKYVVKPGEFLQNPSLVDEYLKAVKGARLVSFFGEYYHVVLNEDEEEEVYLPECNCGRNAWGRLDAFYCIDDIFRDTNGFYRLKYDCGYG